MPESTRKRSSASAKAAAEPDPAQPATPAKTAKAAKATKAAKAAKAEPVKPTGAESKAEPAKKAKAAKAAEPAVPEHDEAADEGTGDEFLNRAARRAKGRGKGGQAPVAGRGASLHGRGAVPGQRQWGNRRTGG